MASTGCAGSAIDQINATIITPSQKSKIFHEFVQISKGNEHPMRPLQRWADLHCKPLKWHITMKEDKDICCHGMEGERGGGNGKHTKDLWGTDVSMPSFVLYHVSNEKL